MHIIYIYITIQAPNLKTSHVNITSGLGHCLLLSSWDGVAGPLDTSLAWKHPQIWCLGGPYLFCEWWYEAKVNLLTVENATARK